MYVNLDAAGQATLKEPRVLDDFKVVALGRDAELLRPADFAELGQLEAGGGHVWVDRAWLRSAGPADADWQAKLAAVIAYAETKGWCDAAGRIRAHIEFTEQD
jgi:hypothetical protein